MEDMVRKLTEAFGPSGDENEITSLIKSLVKGKTDLIYEDSLGNLFIEREGPSPKIMVSAHMDEIGIIVTHIDDEGFIRISPVGGVSPKILPGQRFRFYNGVSGTVYHEKIKNYGELTWESLYLDTGYTSRSAVLEHINIGDMACYDQPFRNLGNGRYMAKAMDDRAGCAVLIETLNNLPDVIPQAVCFVFSAQEEVGLRGAKTAAYRCNPDYGLAVDVTMVGDTPKASTMEVSMGKGPAVKIRDRSVLCHPAIRNFMIETAKNNKIPYQLEVLEKGGTDAGAIHLTREGVPSGALSIPCRYIHTSSEMVDSNDLEQASNFLSKLLNSSWNKLGVKV